MTEILAATTTITTLVGNVFTLMTGNPVLLVFLAASLIGVGISVFRKIKSAAR
ncbi:MAG: hypothetical protein RSE47_07715 [Acidaminococcaceae bacterium]